MSKPTIAGESPQIEQLESGKNYAWCACGLSENQPWCNGKHKDSGFAPKVFKAEESKSAAICMCKQTGNPPFGHGSHMSL